MYALPQVSYTLVESSSNQWGLFPFSLGSYSTHKILRIRPQQKKSTDNWQSSWVSVLTLSFFCVFEVQTGNCKCFALGRADTHIAQRLPAHRVSIEGFRLSSGYILHKSHHAHKWLVLLNQNFNSLGYSFKGMVAWNFPGKCYEEADCKVFFPPFL